MWLWSDARKEVKTAARFAPGRYRCAHCQQTGFKDKEIKIDHIDPVVDPATGWVNWDTYITRLFVSSEHMQALCEPCHQLKTNKENETR
jgi:5-methylcytosine-specific restriction endonuclease McrA